jgi:NAD(P)-dependent dehydrogenase (short-subunit alcohol dehydrogenase family)
MPKKHQFSLEGKTSIVTGAAGYFGRNFAEHLLANGSKIVLFDKDEKVIDLASSLKSRFASENIEHYQVDFYDEDAYRESLTQVVENNDSIDVLVNNAFEFSRRTGFNDPSGKMDSISKDQWMRCLDSGIYWHTVSTQIIGQKMKSQRAGSIINISSMYAVVSPDPALYEGKKMFNPPSYSVSKAGLLAFTRYVASFYGEFGVRCNAILAGAFPHVGIESDSKVDDQEFLDRLAKRTVLGRVGKVEDLLGPLLFLASDASAYVTGHGISVDGGWTIR